MKIKEKKRAKKERTKGVELKRKDKNRIGNKTQENKSILYSAKKINEKNAPPYSVLNPLTNSDSDSLKSNGARWVSAKVQMSQGRKRKLRTGEERVKKEATEKDLNKTKSNTIKVLKTDS
jgi:outer membrane PBP1 activator LpoA protein